MKTTIPEAAVLGGDMVSLDTKTESTPKKDVKEPVQIIRGGRVITLPPIEAPATRSKRLQTKAGSQVKVEKKPHQEHQSPKVEPNTVKSERTPYVLSVLLLQNIISYYYDTQLLK